MDRLEECQDKPIDLEVAMQKMMRYDMKRLLMFLLPSAQTHQGCPNQQLHTTLYCSYIQPLEYRDNRYQRFFCHIQIETHCTPPFVLQLLVKFLNVLLVQEREIATETQKFAILENGT